MADPRTTPPILLVDDEVDIRDALGELLRDEGFTVVTALEADRDGPADRRARLVRLTIAFRKRNQGLP
jgi:DNA-binding response OmpR family regulator